MGKNKFQFGIIVLLIIAAALSRLIPHPANFAPIGAMALFGAAYITNRVLSILVPIIAMWLSDMVLTNVVYSQYYDGFQWYGNLWVYAAFLGIAVIGFVLLKKVNLTSFLGASVLAAIAFFLITNFGTWMSTPLYPKTGVGLIAAYTAGLPFFLNTLLGNLVFGGLMFGVYNGLFSKQDLASAFSRQ